MLAKNNLQIVNDLLFISQLIVALKDNKEIVTWQYSPCAKIITSLIFNIKLFTIEEVSWSERERGLSWVAKSKAHMGQEMPLS